METAVVFILSYLLGAINTADILGRIKKIDITKMGTGNAGAKNVARVLGTKWGYFVGVVDFLKGAIVSFFARKNPFFLIFACIGVLAGHNWSIFMKFKGGSGLAIASGICFALMPVATFFAYFVGFVVGLFAAKFLPLGKFAPYDVSAISGWLLLLGIAFFNSNYFPALFALGFPVLFKRIIFLSSKNKK